jgi:hypothetical protein
MANAKRLAKEEGLLVSLWAFLREQIFFWTNFRSKSGSLLKGSGSHILADWLYHCRFTLLIFGDPSNASLGCFERREQGEDDCHRVPQRWREIHELRHLCRCKRGGVAMKFWFDFYWKITFWLIKNNLYLLCKLLVRVSKMLLDASKTYMYFLSFCDETSIVSTKGQNKFKISLIYISI